ncbi:hypothetical protein KFZ58_13330 [Virgibacillus sp. NKC19-16]|uniref:hypothetical protein n=1 Tax=Virgibacillus salidurans TaxID=2831673 RepID=UPI001F37E12B|nr:hypothetical protein [Virgibacillus sp. NKC19-16]UJL45384.1 hypothetical protein KFZ58_13330 [Virgibacillus sp. NKC19-16]
MTREMLEDLLERFTEMTEEMQDIRENGNHVNQLILKTEGRVNEIETNLNGLQQNLRKLDQKFIIVESLMRTRAKRQMTRKAS